MRYTCGVIFSFRLSLKRQIANSGRNLTLRPATVLVSLIALYWLPFACASHFRFGSISFVPVDGYSRRVTRVKRKPLDWKVSISFIYNPLKSSDIRHVLGDTDTDSLMEKRDSIKRSANHWLH